MKNKEYPSTLQKEFERICKESNLIGATSIVLKDNEIKEALTYGYQSREDKVQTSLNTIYRIASVSKLEVAVCIMQLKEKGLVDLDEDISTYLGFKLRNPKYPDEKITLRMLLTHTSSISDGHDTEIGDPYDTGYLYVITIDEDVDLEDLILEGGKYYVPETFNGYHPGTHFEYSNFGTGICACILERVTKEYFVDYVRENVIKRLGIDGSFIAKDLEDLELASTYYDQKLGRTKESFVKYSVHKKALGQNFTGPAGGLFVSILGLARIMQEYMNDGGCLLKKETMDEMLELNWYGDISGDYTAKGLQFQILDVFDNKRLYGHFGTAYGVKSFMFFNPSQKLGMVFITNGGGYKMLPTCISDVQTKLINLYLDKYWDNDLVYEFKFVPGEEFGYFDGRKIKIKYADPTRKVLSKRPFLKPETIIDGFLVSSLPGKTVLDKEIYGKHIFEYLAYLNNEYDYECITNETFPNGNITDTSNAKYEYVFHIKRRQGKGFENKGISANYHTHCNYCNHASGSVMDYFDYAYKNGYSSLGMSDHGPVPLSFLGVSDADRLSKNEGYLEGQMSYNTFKNKYLADIEEAKNKYKGKMEVLKAIEIEYLRGHDEYYKDLRSYVDYMILGEHYFIYEGKYTSAYSKINGDNVIAYAKEIELALDTKLFKIIAHPDLFMYYYVPSNGRLREFDEKAKKASEIIIASAIRNDVILELNVGGMGKGKIDVGGYLEYTYPRSEFWKIVSEMKGAKVCIGCDAHDVKGLNCNNLYKLVSISKDWGFECVNLKK